MWRVDTGGLCAQKTVHFPGRIREWSGGSPRRLDEPLPDVCDGGHKPEPSNDRGILLTFGGLTYLEHIRWSDLTMTSLLGY